MVWCLFGGVGVYVGSFIVTCVLAGMFICWAGGFGLLVCCFLL